MFRARLLRLGSDDYVLLLILHDLVVDGWSMGIFMEEASELYAAYTAGRPAQLPEPALQFSEFARWQRRWSTSDAASRQFAYWKGRLRGASPIFAANGDISDALLAARIAQEPVHLSKHLVARLSALSHGQGATLFMTLLAGFKTLLLARSGRNDICVATAMANRSQLRTERMIGPVGNTALIRTRLDADLSFQDALRRVRDSVLETYARQELPFDVLAARLAEEEGLDPASLMQVFFVLQNAFRRSLELPDVSVRPFASPERAAGDADRSHLAQGVAQGDPGGHYRHMQLQGRVVRAGRSAALGRALRGDPGQGGRRPRDVARPVGRSLNMRSDDRASRQIRSAPHGSAKLPANRPGFKEYSA